MKRPHVPLDQKHSVSGTLQEERGGSVLPCVHLRVGLSIPDNCLLWGCSPGKILRGPSECGKRGCLSQTNTHRVSALGQMATEPLESKV